MVTPARPGRADETGWLDLASRVLSGLAVGLSLCLLGRFLRTVDKAQEL